VREIDPNPPVTDTATTQARIDESMFTERSVATLAAPRASSRSAPCAMSRSCEEPQPAVGASASLSAGRAVDCSLASRKEDGLPHRVVNTARVR